MSKRLYIVVEGQTEEEFVKDLMAPYFLDHGIYIILLSYIPVGGIREDS